MPPLANRARADVAFSHNGKDYTLRLDFDALEKLSGALSRSIFTIAASIAEGGCKPGEVLAIIHAGLGGGGHDVSEADAKAMVLELGLLRAFKLAADVLLVALAPAKAQEYLTEEAAAATKDAPAGNG